MVRNEVKLQRNKKPSKCKDTITEEDQLHERNENISIRSLPKHTRTKEEK